MQKAIIAAAVLIAAWPRVPELRTPSASVSVQTAYMSDHIIIVVTSTILIIEIVIAELLSVIE
jgi:hypothetical protein